jgi:hypothetical protein
MQHEHGAKKKLCSSEGGTKHVGNEKGGSCFMLMRLCMEQTSTNGLVGMYLDLEVRKRIIRFELGTVL